MAVCRINDYRVYVGFHQGRNPVNHIAGHPNRCSHPKTTESVFVGIGLVLLLGILLFLVYFIIDKLISLIK
jgi:hypothetical protein